METTEGGFSSMWVLRRRGGSLNYLVIWAMALLVLAVGLLTIFFSFLYLLVGVSTFIDSGNIASLFVIFGFIMVFAGVALSYRQVGLLARLRKLEQAKKNVRTGLRLAESLGVDTERASTLYNLAEARTGFNDLRETEKTLAECRVVLESLLTLHTDRLLERTRSRMELKRDSAGIPFSTDSLEPIEKSLESGDYWEVSRLLRSHNVASDRIEKLWLTLKKARKLGVSIEEEVNQTKSVLEAFNQGNFSRSRRDAIRIRDSLNSKIKQRVKECFVTPVRQRIESMADRKVISEEAQRLISEATSNLLANNLEGCIKLARSSEEKINEVAQQSIEMAFRLVEEISDRAHTMGVDVSFVPPRIDIAREDLEAGRLEKSLDILKSLEKNLLENMDLLVTQQFDAIKGSMEKLFLIPETKLELTTRLEEADSERKEGNFENALALAKKISERLKNEEKDSQRAFRSSVRKLQRRMKELENKGISIEKIRKAIEVSKERARNKDFAKAMEIVLNVTEIVDRNLALHRDSVRAVQEVSTLLARTKEEGADVSDLVKRLDALDGIQDPEQVLAEAKEIEELALQRMTGMRERARVELAKLRDQLHSLLEKGVDVGDVPKLMGMAEKYVEKGEFTRAHKITAEAQKGMEAAIELSEAFDSIVSQITETFTTLEKAGIPTSVFESDLQHLLTERSEATLEKLTNLLNEVRSEEEKMRNQAKKSIEETAILIEENPDISFEEEREIIAKAEEAYEAGLYSKAHEIALEAAGRAEKKVELYQLSNELCEKLSLDIERLGKAGFEIAPMESELQLCEMEAEPSLRLEKIRALEANVDRTYTKLNQKMEWVIVEARHGISLLKMNMVSSDDLAEMLESAKELIEEGKLRVAEKKARNVRDLAEERLSQYKEAMERMSALERIMEKAREMDVSVDEYQEDFSWLQNSDDYSHVIEKAGLLCDQINHLFEDRRNEVLTSISDLREEIAQMANEGIRTQVVVEAIEKAEIEISNDDILQAMDTIGIAKERLEDVRESYKKWSEVLSNVEEALEDAKASGIGVKDFTTRLNELKESGDYVSSIPEAERILDDLDSRKTTMSTRALEDIQATREKLEALIQEGAAAGNLLEMLKDAEKSVQLEKYMDSRQKILEVAKSVEKLRKDHESFLEVLEQVRAEVDEAAASGFDMTEILDELEAVRRSEDDYALRIKLVKDLGERASQIAESLSLEASQLISDAAAALKNLRAKGVTSREAEDLLAEAESKMGEGNTFEGKRLAMEVLTIAEEVSALARERDSEYARAKEAIKKAEMWGVDASGLRSDLEDAIQLPVGPESLQRLRAITEEADSLRLSVSEESSARLSALRKEVQRLKGKGVPVANLEAVVRSAETLLAEGKLEEANGLMEGLETRTIEMEELWSEYSEVRERMFKEVRHLEVGKADATLVEKEMSEIESLGVTTEAIEKMEALTEKVLNMKRRLRERTEERLEEVRKYLGRLADKGAQVEEAVNVLYEAEEVLANDSYLRALAKINRAADIGERIERRHNLQNKILETEELLKVANEEGVDVADLIDRVENLKQGEDFAAMTEGLNSIEREINRRRNGLR